MNEELGTVKTPDGKNERNVLSNCSTEKSAKKPRVLFFHGEYTNENIAQYILKLTRWDKYFDFVIPGAVDEGCIAPNEIFDSLGLQALQRAGKYSCDDDFYKWGACYEFISNEPDEVPQDLKDKFQSNTVDYIKMLDKEFGPFDGVMGFCEGGATLNYALGLKEDDKLDGALNEVKFFIHAAPWETPLAGKYHTFPKSIPTLTLYGENEELSGFPEAYARYSKSFKGYYDTYVHDGKHSYPIVSSKLESKISKLLDTVSNSIPVVIENQNAKQYKNDSMADTAKEDEIVRKVIHIVADINMIDESEVSTESSLADDLGMDSLFLMEIIGALEEEFEVVIDTEKQEQMAQEIDIVQDIINFAQQLKEEPSATSIPALADECEEGDDDCSLLTSAMNGRNEKEDEVVTFITNDVSTLDHGESLQCQIDEILKKILLMEESIRQRDEKIQELEDLLQRNKDEFHFGTTIKKN